MMPIKLRERYIYFNGYLYIYLYITQYIVILNVMWKLYPAIKQ